MAYAYTTQGFGYDIDPEWDDSFDYDPPDGAFLYVTNCVHANGQDIQDMVDTFRYITYQTLIKHIPVKELETVFCWYWWKPGRSPGELRLKDDWAVQYAKGVYRGLPCYVVIHSGIEYIFTEGGQRDPFKPD